MTPRVRWAVLVLGGAILVLVPLMAAEHPGQSFHVRPSDLPAPFATPTVENSSHVIARPRDAKPVAPRGFAVSLFASGLTHPRFLLQLPDGDVLVSEPDANKLTLLRGGRASEFAEGFDKPHGLAFHDGAIYVADLKAVWRLAYRDGARKAGARSRVTKDGFGPLGGHFSRDIAFDRSGALYVAIGSMSNVDEEAPPRATVQKVDAQGHLATFVSGTRNPVGLVLAPGTNDLYITVNERDGYGDALVPDYFTRIQQGDFFGWPYAYIGNHPDPSYGAKRPDMVAKTKTPDVLFAAHSAPLGFAFYDGGQFPSAYRGDALVALHGSWNSGKPTGYKVVRVRFAGGRPTGEYEDFLTGFWDGQSSPARVWGRPVGVLVLKDGSVLVSDDAGKAIWRVSYTGK
ncbi:MAG: PQQ-dependent sugar dehydrogenase [Alphaproteobacteria bacterium]|nr:PQQ-dependent sugar dehydrogenase [Alphaproteobacteria bacterium]MBV9693417.1 PQQ-dependent sugar dehydrogenase [Alphaproteobacteria bacterium]